MKFHVRFYFNLKQKLYKYCTIIKQNDFMVMNCVLLLYM